MGSASVATSPSLGPIKIDKLDWDAVEQNPFFCPDADKVAELESYMDALRKEGNSVGARINVVASGVPRGSRRTGL